MMKLAIKIIKSRIVAYIGKYAMATNLKKPDVVGKLLNTWNPALDGDDDMKDKYAAIMLVGLARKYHFIFDEIYIIAQLSEIMDERNAKLIVERVGLLFNEK